jgi:hypothetical protein
MNEELRNKLAIMESMFANKFSDKEDTTPFIVTSDLHKIGSDGWMDAFLAMSENNQKAVANLWSIFNIDEAPSPTSPKDKLIFEGKEKALRDLHSLFERDESSFICFPSEDWKQSYNNQLVEDRKVLKILREALIIIREHDKKQNKLPVAEKYLLHGKRLIGEKVKKYLSSYQFVWNTFSI